MSARDRVDDAPEVTARPKSMAEELSQSSPVGEVGLSIDPEDLGRQFLSGATEQGNFESSHGGDSADLWVNAAPPGDDALTGPNFESDASVWENTVALTMENGSPDGAQEGVSQRAVDDDDSQADGLEMIDRDGDDVDVTESVIKEASLLDHEADLLGETEAPNVRDEDSNSRMKRRGGHAPKEQRATARAR